MIPSFDALSKINSFLESPSSTDDLEMVLKEDQLKLLVEMIRVHVEYHPPKTQSFYFSLPSAVNAR